MSALRIAFSRSTLPLARSTHSSAALSEAAKSALELALRDGLKTAMKSRDKPAVSCLKSILADITNVAKSGPNPNDPLPESAVMSAVRKGIQSRNTAAESYSPSSASPHPENHANLTSEVSLLQSYLPATPSIESITGHINDIIGSLEESVKAGKGVQGVVMKSLWEKLGEAAGAVDRKEIGRIVGEALKK